MMSEDILRLIERFWSAAQEAAWGGDHDNISGMAYDVDNALEIHSNLFREESQQEEGDTLHYVVEWLGKGRRLHDLVRDFYLLFSEVAEESSFFHWTLGRDEVTFFVAAGHVGDRPHGHFVVVRLVGQAVRETLEGYRRIAGGNRNLVTADIPRHGQVRSR